MNANLVYSSSYLFCVAAFICAIPLYAMLRRNSPEMACHRYGKVSTTFFNRADILGILFFLGIYGWYLTLAQAPPELNPDGSVREIKITPPVVATQMISQIVPGIIVLALLMFRNVDLVQLFGLKSKNSRYLIVIAPIGVILAFLTYFALQIGGYFEFLEQTFGKELKEQEAVRVYKESSGATIRVLLAVSVCVIAPFIEELVFRGYIYSATKRFSDRLFATLFSSLFFALVHFNINAILPLFILAIILVIAYEITGSLWAPISIHALFNISNLVLMELDKTPGN